MRKVNTSTMFSLLEEDGTAKKTLVRTPNGAYTPDELISVAK